MTKETQAACYCVDPTQCVCSTAASEVPGADHEGSFNGIPIRCTDPRDLNSIFSIKDPVCDSRWNNEIPPSCSYTGNDWEIVCWGTGFTVDTGTIPLDTGGHFVDWHPYNPAIPGSGSPPVSFNGWSSDTNGNGLNDETPAGGSGITLLQTCHSNVFCCGRSGACNSGSEHEITGGCGPKVGAVSQAVEAACHGVGGGPGGNHSGQGESRLWFSQARLISALASIAQTMFNPFKLDNRYQDTALSKNSPVSNPSGGIDNQGTLTTRVERYQGVHDNTLVVNQDNNNSSVIVGNPAPVHLFDFDNSRENFPYDDARACYIPNALSNPGDDLIGPRIKGELIFTEEFTYEPLPNTDCVPNGGSYTPAAGETGSRCCSQNGRSEGACRVEGTFPCEFGEGEVALTCGGVRHCCPTGTTSCAAQVIFCDPPDFIELPAEGYVEVFSKTPIIELIYNTVVEGTDSLYKRFFPIQSWVDDQGVDIPLEEIPAKTGFKAAVSGPNINGVTFAEGQASSPEIYFPHVGSLDKYWLYDFQKALRPKGYERGATTPSDPGAPQCKLGFGPCSVANLTQSFSSIAGGSCGVNEATIASQLCQRESTSGPFAANTSCLTAPTGGFAIGLFQVNLAPVPRFDPVTGDFIESRDIGRCLEFGPAGSTFLLDAQTAEEARRCRINPANPTDCSDLIPGLTNCNVPLRNCIEKFFDIDENIEWTVNRACSGSGGGCQCDWSPWYFDPAQYPNACNPIP